MTLPELTVDAGFDAVVCTLDGFNYLTPSDLRLTMNAVAGCLRPAGWLVFDLHTDAMMNFTIANPTVAGESAGNDFVISSVVDPGARTCDTRIELTRTRDGQLVLGRAVSADEAARWTEAQYRSAALETFRTLAPLYRLR